MLAKLRTFSLLGIDALPVDIRHASKVDRSRLAAWATAVLEGGDGRKSPT